MTLYQRKRVWWVDLVDEDGRRIRRSTRCRDKSAARIIEAGMLRGIEMRRAGIMVADSAAELRPIMQVLDAYVGQLDQRGDHHRIVRWRLARAVEAAGWAMPRDITPESVNRHLDALKVKPRTRNQVRAAIGSWCDWMMRQRPPLIAANPLLHVATAPETRDPMRWPLGDAEFEALLAAEPTKHVAAWRLRRLAYLLAGEAGLRRSDCRHLTAGRVRLAGVSPFVELPSDVNKSRRWQQVPLTPRLAEALGARVLGGGSGGRALEAEERVLPGVPAVAMLRADLRRAGVDPTNPTGLDVDFHSLRHTFVARLARRGVPAQVAQLLARHQDIGTTSRIYGQLGISDAVAGIAALGDSGGVTQGVPHGVPLCAANVPGWQRERVSGA